MQTDIQTLELMLQQLQDREQIRLSLTCYAEACDRRDWSLLEQFFTEDVVGIYGAKYHLYGRTAMIKMIRKYLDNCGPTQHLLGNTRIHVGDKEVRSAVYVRAVHASKYGGDQIYEVWAEYRDLWCRTEQGWRSYQREMQVFKEIGNKKIVESW